MAAFIPLAKPLLDGNERRYLNECIDAGYVTHAGRFEGAFEKAFSDKFGSPSLATSSGTGALHLALLSLGIGPGDECIVPSFTFGATASVILAVGARPVILDVDADTWGLDRNRVLATLTKRTRAILPVHIYGENARSFSQFGIPVVEDSCEALGTVPISGRFACYSFYGNKPLTTGEGGMLCGSAEDLLISRQWRDGGFDDDYRNIVPGLNYRMSNMQAAIGLAQLERFDDLLGMRLANVKRYSEALPGHGKWLFCVETSNPRGLAQHLKKNGVDTRPLFTPLHLSPAFRQYAKGKYKISEQIWSNHLALPTGPHVSAEQVEQISELIHESGYLRASSERAHLRAASL